MSQTRGSQRRGTTHHWVLEKGSILERKQKQKEGKRQTQNKKAETLQVYVQVCEHTRVYAAYERYSQYEQNVR